MVLLKPKHSRLKLRTFFFPLFGMTVTQVLKMFYYLASSLKEKMSTIFGQSDEGKYKSTNMNKTAIFFAMVWITVHVLAWSNLHSCFSSFLQRYRLKQLPRTFWSPQLFRSWNNVKYYGIFVLGVFRYSFEFLLLILVFCSTLNQYRVKEWNNFLYIGTYCRCVYINVYICMHKYTVCTTQNENDQILSI